MAPLLKVRVEEILIGAMAGAIAGTAAASPALSGLALSLHQAGIADALRMGFGLASAGVGALGGAWLAATQRSIDHVRGVEFLSAPARARRALQDRERQLMSAAQRKGEVRGLCIGGVDLARKREVGHIYLVGLPGAGKTVTLSAIISQARERGDRLLFLDTKGDYTAKLWTENGAALLGPWDERAAIWDVSADMDSPARAQEFARLVVGEGGAKGENAFFYETARRLFAGLVLNLPHGWTWRDLYGSLIGDPVNLVRLAASKDPQVPLAMPSFSVGGEVSDAEKNVLSTLVQRTGWIAQMAAVDTPSRPRISIRAWLQGHGPRLLILNNNSDFKIVVEPLFGTMLSVAASVIASADMPEITADEPGFWMILDEFPQIGNASLEPIQRIEELGRSRGVRVIKALQDESQLTALVGRDKAAPIISMQSTKVYCRTADATAEAVSKRIGEREIRRYQSTADGGALPGKSAMPDRQQVLNPSDLLGLQETRNGVEMLIHIEDTIGKTVQQFGPNTPSIAEAFVESAAWRDGPQFSLPESTPEISHPRESVQVDEDDAAVDEDHEGVFP
ncbi:MAG: type IV secretion system DNA-binding domain-containing protein [Betaproteobacteria bacterium]|nr:type IV secretion system DNA-binding domain-containing protein [Betaproteobacteria bacterium]